MNDIKMMLFEIDTDGDFCWNSNAFPKDENGIIKLYFKNPTIKDLNRVLTTIADDFLDSFSFDSDEDKEYFEGIKQTFYNHLLTVIDINEDIGENKNTSLAVMPNKNIGNYSIKSELIDFKESKIKFVNSDEELIINEWDIDYEDILANSYSILN